MSFSSLVQVQISGIPWLSNTPRTPPGSTRLPGLPQAPPNSPGLLGLLSLLVCSLPIFPSVLTCRQYVHQICLAVNVRGPSPFFLYPVYLCLPPYIHSLCTLSLPSPSQCGATAERVGLGSKRYRVRNYLVLSGFSLRQKN